jgi:hypothetical protein
MIANFLIDPAGSRTARFPYLLSGVVSGSQNLQRRQKLAFGSNSLPLFVLRPAGQALHHTSGFCL